MCIMHQLVPRDLLLNFGGGINYSPLRMSWHGEATTIMFLKLRWLASVPVGEFFILLRRPEVHNSAGSGCPGCLGGPPGRWGLSPYLLGEPPMHPGPPRCPEICTSGLLNKIKQFPARAQASRRSFRSMIGVASPCQLIRRGYSLYPLRNLEAGPQAPPCE